MRGFRTWHTELGRYLKDNEFYINPDGSVYSAFESYDNKIRNTNYIENFSRDDFDEGYINVEQYTGLKDKNGKEIYENDILQIDDHILGDFEVLWHNLGWAIKRSVGFETLAVHKSENIVIVGNVHENADLLGELK